MRKTRGSVYEPSGDSDLPLVAVIFDEDGKLAQAVIVQSVAEGEAFVELILSEMQAGGARGETES